VSAAATEVLARKDAKSLAILGSGTQAIMHLEAMQKVRTINRVRVWSPNADHSHRFATTESRKWNLPISAVPTAREAVREADIICTATSASSPVLLGEWLEPGVHINAIGASRPPNRELDSDAVMKSKLFVDRRESALKEAEDFLAPKREGEIDDSHILGELGELLVGRVQGRTSEVDITVFKSVGLALEDLASAYHIYSKAKTEKIGTWVEFGGERSV
jgi:ornithine cyclodeaminase